MWLSIPQRRKTTRTPGIGSSEGALLSTTRIRELGHMFFKALTIAGILGSLVASNAKADVAADTVKSFGLLGTWRRDCAIPSTENNNNLEMVFVMENGVAYLGLGLTKPNRRHEDFAALKTEILKATSSDDKITITTHRLPANIVETFEKTANKKTGVTITILAAQQLGYAPSIVDRRYLDTGKETPVLHLCSRMASEARGLPHHRRR